MKTSRVLTIAGSDSGGGAGIQADLKTITVLGGFGMSVLTALTAQNTLGVHGIHEVPLPFIEAQFDAVVSDIGVDAAKTGMLSSADIIRTVAGKIRQYGIEKLVVDPVMVAKGGARLLREEAKDALVRDLLPLAFVLTPNIPEAEALCGKRISSPQDMKDAAGILHGMGPRHVVIKGGHLEGEAVDLLFDGRECRVLAAERIETKDTHGTGCTFSAAIATGLALGMTVREAVERAKDYITTAIRYGLRIGGGHGPTDHFAPLRRELETYRTLDALKKAAATLAANRCGNIIPEVQTNLGFALPDAREVSDVAAFPGRILRVGDDARNFCDPDFGASSHVAKIILTAMRFDENARSAMNIRCSEDVLTAARELGYDVDSFDRADEPDDAKRREGATLEWGTRSVLSRRETIPDVIYDRGEVGKEPMVRILGRRPEDVVAKAVRISRKLRVPDGTGKAG